MPCPWGASKEPITLPFLSMWIMAGGRTQQSASGGFSSASSSISVRSLGRSKTQTLSSLSTARPVTPPIFHLFGSGLGQSGSYLNFGAVSCCAPSARQKTKLYKSRPLRLMSPPVSWNYMSARGRLLKSRCIDRSIGADLGELRGRFAVQPGHHDAKRHL